MNVIPESNHKQKRDYCQYVALGLSNSQDRWAIMIIMNKVMNFYIHTYSQILKILQKAWLFLTHQRLFPHYLEFSGLLILIFSFILFKLFIISLPG